VIANHGIDFWHGLPCLRINLGGASGDNDLDIRVITAGFADHLARLFLSFGRDSTGINDNHIIASGLAGMFANNFAFPAIQSATKGF
jgi:hypothetical protein